MSILDVLRQNQQFYSDLDQGVVSGNRLPLLPNENVMYGSVIPNIDYSVSPQEETEEELDISKFENIDLQPGYLDRAGSLGTNFNFNPPTFLDKVKSIPGGIMNYAQDMYGSSRNLIGQGIGTLAGLALGIPGLGTVLGSLKETPTDKFSLGIAQTIGDPYGYKSALSSGNLGARQDPFGRNVVSAFDNYEKNRQEEIEQLEEIAKFKELTKFQQAKLDYAKQYQEKLEQERQKAIDESFKNAPPESKGNKGADFTGGRFDRAGSREAYDRNPTGYSGSF